ncbi:HNH endonuclease [Nesterenkonia muleiensis]|uniref:HNH endonuclease n=1 Tax=Nesterenkonia muleiensis TaxID=2282648 RepID=UPI000E748671|nr:HNH endonuclease signature motif containing protein [Nesterenkonia muleiensis]
MTTVHSTNEHASTGRLRSAGSSTGSRSRAESGGVADIACGADSAAAQTTAEAERTGAPPVLREPRTTRVWEMERELRRAKSAQLGWMLGFHDDNVAQARVPYVEDYESARAREASAEVLRGLGRQVVFAEQEAGRAAIMFIAEAVGRSEYVVTTEYLTAARAKRQLPRVWEAFQQGRICDFRLRKITTTAEKLTTESAVADLDQQAPGYAESHRVGELNNWLKEFEHTAEPAQASQRFTQAARTRRVTVTDIEDGMSVLTAIIPTLTAHAIQRRLDATTRSATHPVPHNPLIAEHTMELQQQEGFARLIPHTKGSKKSPVNDFTEDLPVERPAELPAEFQNNPCITPGYSLGDGPWGTNAAPTLHITDGTHPAEGTQDHPPQNQGRDQHHRQGEGLPSQGPKQNQHQGQHRDQGSAQGAHWGSARFSINELPTTRENGDPRILDQRAADVFCAWMLNTQTPEGIEIDAQIGIIVHEEAFTGRSQQPGITRDRKVPIPARNLHDLLEHQINRLEWYQLLHGAEDDLLAIRSSGRYPPPRLRTALWFRDRTCQTQGCTVPAERCDTDHITPYDTGGPTTAENLQLLCRRHHRLKSWNYPLRADLLHTDITHAA